MHRAGDLADLLEVHLECSKTELFEKLRAMTQVEISQLLKDVGSEGQEAQIATILGQSEGMHPIPTILSLSAINYHPSLVITATFSSTLLHPQVFSLFNVNTSIVHQYHTPITITHILPQLYSLSHHTNSLNLCPSPLSLSCIGPNTTLGYNRRQER